jgi:farnesyl diphosphate synthase
LCYATGLAVDAKPEQLDHIAAAIEFIHCYSLVHDDLPAMDDDDLRRGRPTCHVVYDEATAILVGDALQSMAFECLSEMPFEQNLNMARLVKMLAQAAGGQGMVDGQMIDMESEGQSIDIEKLALLHRKKTGALIQASVNMAADIGAQAQKQQTTKLSEFGQLIGLAFQIKDDILDVEADSNTLGKPQGSDAEADKSTYPKLLGLNGAKDKAQNTYQQALTALNDVAGDTSMLEQLATIVVERTH